jgi:hypothetical protein
MPELAGPSGPVLALTAVTAVLLAGGYWSATEGRHVIYESRLELARLLFSDFDRSVHRICAQPFSTC